MTVAALVSESPLVDATCLSSDTVGDCVTIVADRVGRLYQVAKIDPREFTPTAPIVSSGVIESKSSATTCKVRIFGLLKGHYTGLDPGALLWVGLDGRLTQDQLTVTALAGQHVLVQQLGVALASDTVQILPQGAFARKG